MGLTDSEGALAKQEYGLLLLDIFEWRTYGVQSKLLGCVRQALYSCAYVIAELVLLQTGHYTPLTKRLSNRN